MGNAASIPSKNAKHNPIPQRKFIDRPLNPQVIVHVQFTTHITVGYINQGAFINDLYQAPCDLSRWLFKSCCNANIAGKKKKRCPWFHAVVLLGCMFFFCQTEHPKSTNFREFLRIKHSIYIVIHSPSSERALFVERAWSGIWFVFFSLSFLLSLCSCFFFFRCQFKNVQQNILRI